MPTFKISEGEDLIVEKESRAFGSQSTRVFKISGTTGSVEVVGILKIDGVNISPSDAALAEALASDASGQGASLVTMEDGNSVQLNVVAAQDAADAAQTDATQALSDADAAQTDATQALSDADAAQTDATQALSDADAAQDTAADALAAAAAASASAALVQYLSQDLPDADATIDGTYGQYVVQSVGGVGTYTGNHTVTLDDATALNRQELTILTESANGAPRMMTVHNGGPGDTDLLVFDVTTHWKAVFIFDGTNWFLDRQSRLA